MKIIPLAEYYEKHGSQILDLLPKGGSSDPSFLTDLLAAVTPVLKKHRPDWNNNGLLDDTLALLRVELTPEPPISNQQASDLVKAGSSV